MKRTKKNKKTRAEPSKAMVQFLTCDSIEISGYTKLSDCPEIRSGIERIAELIASMTIHLMKNGEDGDIRVKNELAKKVDINPYSLMTGYNFKFWLAKTLLLNGNAYVYPKFNSDEMLEDLIPFIEIPTIIPTDCGYIARFMGGNYFNDEILHFSINPKIDKPFIGESYKVVLRDIIKNLRQASKTTNEFMSSKVMPSLIVKVDSGVAEIASEEGRESVYNNYLATANAGEPWIIPAEMLEVQQIKPLTLNDIAIKDTVILDKKTVASILAIPPFLLGIGDFNEKEFNNFIRTRVMSLAKNIEQELTKKLLISPDLYWKFNSRSLYAYSLSDMSKVGTELYIRGIMTGNEVRDWIGLSPLEGLSELVILENYIPLDKIGEQKKLGGENDV
ncbi:phage portal protein [Peptostreptococcus porci]|uniref:phage portal protein n=1 Tax=Peptostreptococcus porci TaxID=2652282 RepID=UPI002A7FAC81|nr:phage portal protein [Peptostreptococcus porci]MDY4128690.1 phage portal protein [Peptostreptococcus porci]